MTQRNFQYYLFLLVFFLALQQAKAQHSQGVLVDSSNFSVTYQCSKISFDPTISNRRFWVTIFAQDSLLTTFIKQYWHLSCFDVNVLEVVKSGPLTYQFMTILTSVEYREDSTGFARRPNFYQVTFGKSLSGTNFLLSVSAGRTKGNVTRREF